MLLREECVETGVGVRWMFFMDIVPVNPTLSSVVLSQRLQLQQQDLLMNQVLVVVLKTVLLLIAPLVTYLSQNNTKIQL